jgi:hypothetical protein
MADEITETDVQVPCGECGHDPSKEEEPIGRVTDSWLWIRDTKGYGSVTVTFVTIAFFVTTLAYVLSIVEAVGPVAIRPFDVAACSAYFIPVLTLYFGRKFTEAKHPSNGKA